MKIRTLERLTNVAIGYGVAVGAQLVVFPLFGIHASLTENLLIGLVFTGVSIVRSFALRRLFEAIRIRQSQKPRTGPAVRVSLNFEDSVSGYLNVLAATRLIHELDAMICRARQWGWGLETLEHERSRLVKYVAKLTDPVTDSSVHERGLPSHDENKKEAAGI